MKGLHSSLEACWLGFQASTAMAQVQSRVKEQILQAKEKRRN